MGLINLKTDLKSLRYGKDTIGGGYSGQPYIQTPIPDSFNNLGANEDFILRGGINAVKDSAVDIKRLGKMFGDLKSPNGLLFIAKQQLLSQTAVRTQTSGDLNEGIYSPLNTLAEAGLVAFGGHLNKQGINPFDETGAYANNNNLYSTRMKNYNQEWLDSPDGSLKNRLFALYESKIQNNEIGGFAKVNDISSLSSNILSYTGGPGSILGIGNTNIRFADQRTGINNALLASGPVTWTPNQSISRSFNDLITIETLKGVSKEYEKTNFRLDSDFKNGDKVYNNNSEVGVNGKLFNPLASGPVTWTPRSIDKDNKQVGGLQIDWLKPWTKQNKYHTPSGDIFSIDLPNSNVNTPQSSSLYKIPDGKPTWTPKQSNDDSLKYLKSIFYNDTNKGVSGKYNRLINSDSNSSILSSYKEDGSTDYSHNVYEPATEGNTWPTNSSLINAQNAYTYTQKDIIQTKKNEGGISSPKIQDFRATLRVNENKNPQSKFNEAKQAGQLAESLNYNTQNFEQRVKIGDPGQRGNNDYSDYAKGVRNKQKPNAGSAYAPFGTTPGGLDRINSIPIYRSKAVTTEYKDEVNDFVKFRIAVIDNDAPNFKTFMHFRAFLGPITDSYNAQWNNFQYLGRGENFYTYGGFTRTLSLSWTVAAQSKEELIPMYKKLNYLASTLAPDYSPKGYMRGNLVQLTIGGYLYEQPGFITSLTYQMEEDSPWEIGIGTTKTLTDSTVKELCQIIRVTGFTFTPIHNFIPQLQDLSFATNTTSDTSGDTGFVSTNGDQRYIALANGDSQNYNN